MDAKITLSFDQDVIKKAKKFADDNNISLSRLTEFIYSRMVSGYYQQLEDLPIADWVNSVAEGEAEYHTRPRSSKSMRDEFRKRK